MFMLNGNEILLYQSEDGESKIEVKLEGETVWLTQDQMAELFQRDKSVIARHIRNIYETGELILEQTLAKNATVGSDRKLREINYYNLDMIISVGYRVNSHRGTQFRIWATNQLREYIVKGFVMNDERLSEGHTNYFDELIERVRRIRTSEANFYDKVRGIFATSIDYDPRTDYAKQFYATVQNKFHFAIHGHTAAELIASRVDSTKPHMGLTNWKGNIVTRKDAEIAKNYLEELELKRLELLVEQFLSFAELRSLEQTPMYMSDWLRKLDDFLILNEKEILTNAGSISHKEMEVKVRDELAKFNQFMAIQE
jgi:hypothetical protein